MVKTISYFLLLFLTFLFFSCATKSPEITVADVDQAQKIIDARRAEQAKNANKIKKEAMKRNLKMQSKPVRKSLKRNSKALKKRVKFIEKNKS